MSAMVVRQLAGCGREKRWWRESRAEKLRKPMSTLNSPIAHPSFYNSLILVTNDIRQKYHGVFKKARQEKITAKRLSAFLWYVARKAAGHGEYLVQFHEVQDQIFVSCNDIHTGERCKGTLRQRRHFQNPMCAHIAQAIDRAAQYGARKQKLEIKEAA